MILPQARPSRSQRLRPIHDQPTSVMISYTKTGQSRTRRTFFMDNPNQPDEYEQRGRYVVRDEILCYLAEVEARAGNWDVAAAHADEAYEIDVESGRLSGQG